MAEQQTPGTSRAKYSYRTLVDTWRAEFPGEFDGFNAQDLADAILAEVPEFRGILDESTRGTESVPPPNLGGYEVGPRLRTPQPPAPPDRPLRQAGLTDMAIEAGLVTVPSIAGGMLGGPAGLLAGGMAGEALREGWQNLAGTRDDGLSLPNIAAQGAINMIPIARGAGAAAKYLAPELLERVAPPLVRVAGSALEGAVGSAASQATEAVLRDTRLPEFGEVATAGVLGAPFGAAVGGAGELIRAIRAGRATPDAAHIDTLFTSLQQPTGPSRQAAAQAIYDLADAVGQKNPAAGAALLQRLLRESEAISQADLQQYAAAFVQDFGRRADTLTMDGQIGEVEQFLAGLKERGANQQVLGMAEQILTDIQQTSSPRPIDQPSEVGWYTPYDSGVFHEVAADPGRTSAEQHFGAAFEQALGSPGIERGTPSMYDPQAAASPQYTAREVPPRQQHLKISEGAPPLRPGPDLAVPPKLVLSGVDALPSVQTGTLARDEALLLHWISRDLQEHGFERGTARRVTDTEFRPDDPLLENHNVVFTPHAAGTPILQVFDQMGVGMTRRQIATQIDNLLEGRARRPGKAALAARKVARALGEAWVPAERRLDWSRVTPETLQALGFRSRAQLRGPMSPLGFHTTGQPGDLVERFLPGEQQRRAAELEGATEGDAPTPITVPAGPRASDLAPDAVAEARQLVRAASDEDLRRLYAEMSTYSARTEDLEGAEDFSGAWYDVGPGLIAEELERRGLGRYSQPGLAMEGPGTPGRQPLVPDEAPKFGESVHGEVAAAQPGQSGQSGQSVQPDQPGQPGQPALLPEVRTTERAQPLLMEEAELFSLTPESQSALEAPRRSTRQQRPLFGDETGAVGRVRNLKLARSAAQRDVRLSPADFEDLRATVQAAGDTEVAGLLVGDPDGTVRRVVLSDNRAADPGTAFEIGPDVVQRAQLFARARGWEVLGSFHSQPTGSAEPSKRDLRGNVADLPMLILGVRGGSLRDVRIWQPAATKSAPWLEGQVTIADAPSVAAPAAPAAVARWAVERIPKFTGAPGDTPALVDYLRTHKAEFATEPWYVRVQQFLDEGNGRQAWVELQAATLATQRGVRDVVQSAGGLLDRERAALLARVEQATAAGPQDPVGALFALYDGRTTWVEGVGRVVVAPEIPPALKGKGVSAGPGGILHPGQADIPLPSEQSVVSMTVEALNAVLHDTDAHRILDDPTQASFTRLNRQIAEQLMLRAPSSWGATKAMRTAMKQRGMSDREINRQIAVHLTKTASESGRFLAALSVWKQRNKTEIRAIEGIKGASGDIDDVLIIGAGGRRIGRLGDLAPADTFKDIVAPTRAWDRALLLNALTRQERGAFDVFESASRAFMLSQWATAARNFWSVNARWGVEMFDEVAAAVASTTLARPGRAINHLRRAGDLLRYTPLLRPDGWVMPWHARQAQWEQVFDSTAYLASLPVGKERQAALRLLNGIPEEQAHFLGSTAFGEPTPHGQSKYRALNAIASPRVQNTLTMFNRAQEFTARSAMYTVNLREQLRAKGLDPELLWQLPPADLAAKLGGQDQLQRALNHAISGALDYTFSGETVRRGFGLDQRGQPKGAWYDFIIEGINRHPTIRAGYPWPRFNLSAAPRFIWDHSGVNAVVESINDGLLRATGDTLGVKRGRFFLGRQAAKFERELIPEAQQKFRDAQADMGEQLQTVQALSREATIRRRLVARMERRGLVTQAGEARQQLETINAALEREMAAFERAEDRAKGLSAQMAQLQKDVDQAKAVRAPETYAELWGRAGAGVATMLMPAILLRAEQQEKGTKWYELRYDLPGLGDTIIDTRPLAPFTQFLFFADVINDLDTNTDWAGVSEDLAAGVGMSEAIYGRYEGKYTAATLGQQTLNAFLSMSQAAGTTLAVVEELTTFGERGLDTKRLGGAVVEAVGNLLARFTIPFAQLKGLTDLAAPEESHARITSTDQGTLAPLAQPLGNLPFIGAAVIPDTYNQLTGQPLDAYLPGLRASLGITLRQWNRVVGEINNTGVPGSAVYVRTTHDPFLDRLIGYHYSQAVSQYADPLIFANEYYLTLDSPATRRDYLQSTVFPTLKKLAIGQAMIDVGWKRMTEAREGAEQRRRRLRWERLNGLAREEGITFAEDGDAADEPAEEPDTPVETGDEMPAAPAGPPRPDGGQTPQASLSAPRFEEEEKEDRRPAFDRLLAPAFPG